MMLNQTTVSHWQQLRQAITPWATLSDGQWDQFRDIFVLKTVEPKAYYALPGSHLHELVFVTKGLLRYYFIDRDGEENNKAFIKERMFAGPLASAALDLPVYYGVQALEPTEMVAADIARFRALYDVDPIFERIGRRFTEMLLLRKELRTRSLLLQTASERYEDFVRDHPDLLERVAQYHIASYLGVTEVSLSRLKKK